MTKNDPRLTRIASDSRYTPSGEAARALFYFVTGDWDALAKLDPRPGNPLLFLGYTGADERMKMAVLHRAKESPACALFAHTLIGDGAQNRMKTWSVTEWKLVMQGLVAKSRWDEIWRILFSAPLPLAVSVLHHIRASGWTPPGDERALRDQLIDTLPDSWTFPAPEPLMNKTLERPVSHTTNLAFSQDGSLLATSGSEGVIRIWRVAGGTLLHALQAGTGAARALAFTPDRRQLVCTGGDGLLRCWDPITGNLIWDTHHEPTGMVCMAVTPDSVSIISGGADGHIRIMDVKNGHITASREARGCAIFQIAISPDGRKIASAGSDGTICIHTYDCLMMRQEWSVTQHGLQSLAFTCGNDRLITIGRGHAPIIRDVTSGKPVQTLAGDDGGTPYTVSFYGTGIAIGNTDGTLSIWQLPSGIRTSIPVYHQGIASCTTNADGNLVVTGCNNGIIRFFDLPEGTPVREFKAHAGPVIACAISPDDTTLASCGWDGTVKIWNLPSGELVHILKGRAGEVTCLCSMPDGDSVITGNTDGTASVLCTAGGQITRTIDLFTTTVAALALNPEGTLLACAGGDTTVRIWRIADGGLSGTCTGLTSTTRCLTFTPDGKTLVTGGWDGKIRFWQVPDGRIITTSPGHTGVVTFCAAPPSGSFIVSVGSDANVRLWNPVSGNIQNAFGCGWQDMSAGALSPDGLLLALGRKDGSLCTVNLPSGTQAAALPKIPVKVTALAFTRDSGTLIAGYETGSIAIFSLADSRLIQGVSAHTGAISGIAPLLHDDLVVTSGRDGACRVWNLPFTRQPKETCPDDIARIADIIRRNPKGAALPQWQFLEHFLHGRFRHEIEICTRQPVAGAYDIQIVG
jgi:WD40 repeat protein